MYWFMLTTLAPSLRRACIPGPEAGRADNGVYFIPEVLKSGDEFVRWHAARPVRNFRIDC